MEKVLFVCIHNSARSQMAEAYLNHFAGEKYSAESAGLEPGNLNPFVVKVMQEDGIDISGNDTNSVYEFFKEGRFFNYVVAVCDKEASEKCPVFPSVKETMHWGFRDPSSVDGTDEEKLAFAREVRDEIKARIQQFLAEGK
jgi:arsenate reductase